MLRYRFFSFFLLLTVLILSGCKLAKEVKPPTDMSPAQFRSGAAADSTSVADLQWKNFFTDPGLKTLIDKAIVKNMDMQVALQNIEIARQTLKQAKLNWLPALTGNVTAASNIPSKNSLNGSLTNQYLGTNHIEDFSANIGFSWEIDIWGRIRNTKRAALATFLQSTEVRNALQTTIVANVAQSYYQLLMLDAQLEIAHHNQALRDSTLQMIRLQRDAGQVTTLAVQQAEAQLLVATQLVQQLEQNSTIQENTLSILCGELPAAIARNSRLAGIQPNEQLPTGFPAAMMSRRPDVRSAELALRAANARVGVAKASFYPALTITATGGLNSFKAHNWFTVPASLFGNVAGGLAEPIFHRRQIKTNYEIAKAEREKTVIQFRQSVLNAVGEVSNALIKVEKLQAQYTTAQERVTILNAATQNANLLFKSGMANYLEVITAQSTALQSELDLVALQRERLVAVVELYRALGGGWQ